MQNMEEKSHTILIVDDEPQTCANIGKILSKKGFISLEAHNGAEALSVLKEKFVDLVLLDVKMPQMGGLEALKKIKEKYPGIEVIMATAFSDLETAIESMKHGAFGFLAKPVNAEHLVMEINKALDHRRMLQQIKIYEKRLEMKVDDKAEEVKYLYGLLEANFVKAIHVFLDLIALNDPFLTKHSKRVAELAVKTGQKFNLNEKRLLDLEQAALLHDIGKLGVPERIRFLPYEDLNPKEKALMQKQTLLVQQTLAPVSHLQRAGLIIKSRTERADGKGFPEGFKGDEIPIESQILSVANTFENVARNPMKKESDEYAAVAYLERETGSRFRQKVVKMFLEAFEELKFQRKQEMALPLAELKEGMVLTKNIVDDNGQMVFSKGSRLTAAQIAMIKNHDLFTGPVSQRIFVYKQSLE
jgi:response regulator RpfG family c-di-GMP phosphodiesterase